MVYIQLPIFVWNLFDVSCQRPLWPEKMAELCSLPYIKILIGMYV